MSVSATRERYPLPVRFGVSCGLVALLAAALHVAGCNSCASDEKAPPGPDKPDNGSVSVKSDGVFVRQKGPRQSPGPTPQELERRQLAELGYLTGYHPAIHKGGVTLHDEGRVHRGYNLYTSGHLKGATLMDMEGKVLHRWEFDPSSELVLPLRSKKEVMGAKYMRRAHLYPNGDLLALYDFVGLAKIDRSSRKIWFEKARYHHDIFVHEDGDIYTLDEELADGSIFGLDRKFIDNNIVVLSPQGKVKRKVSLARCFARSLSKSELLGLFDTPQLSSDSTTDLLHANSIEVLGGGLTSGHAALKKGNVLISIRTISTIAVIDIEKEVVELWLRGDWTEQHEARSQPSGSILFFDNNGKQTYSRVIELDPVTTKSVWTYVADPPTAFYSRLQGTVDRLPNGNTLVVESAWGRAFELDPQKEKVWQFESPYRSAEDDELIAVLFDMTRLESDFPLDWASGGKPD